jgi:hypothetical protein
VTDLDQPAAPAPAASPARWWSRLWQRPLWVHVVAAGLVLLVAMAATHRNASFSSDEGAAILQAQRLDSGNGWLRPNELPTLDPTGAAYFITLSDGGPTEFATYGKHPTYPVVLAALDRVGGESAMEVGSILGALAAAVAAALIARRLDRRLDRLALWTVVVGSPLLFDSQIVVAHAIGAAFAGFAVLAVLHFLDRPSVPTAVSAAALFGVCTLLRTEALLLALALAAVLVVMAARRRSLPIAGLGALVVGVSGAALVFDRVAQSHIVGSSVSVPSTIGSGFLDARLSAAANTLVLPGATWPTYVYDGLLVMVLAVIAGALVVRAGSSGTGFRVLCVVAMVGAVLPFAVSQPDTISSILIAFPVLTAAIFLVRPSELPPAARVLLWTGCWFTVLVIVLQYNQGGGAEWGARFLAIGVPIFVPVALLVLARAAERMPRPDRRWGAVTLVVVSLAMAVLSLSSLRFYRGVTADWVGFVDRAVAATPGPGPDLGDGDRRPIVLTTWAGLGRDLWPSSTPMRGLTPSGDELRSSAQALHDAGVEHLVFATQDPSADLPALAGLYTVTDGFPTKERGPVFVLTRS